MGEYVKPTSKRVIRGYDPEDYEDSSDSDDGCPVIRYAKKPKAKDLSEEGRFEGDPIQLVNQLVNDVCPFHADDCWKGPDEPTHDADSNWKQFATWTRWFEMPAFTCLRRSKAGQGDDQVISVEEICGFEEKAGQKMEAQRKVAKAVLEHWHKLGLVTSSGVRLVDRPEVYFDSRKVTSMLTPDGLRERQERGELQQLQLEMYGIVPELVQDEQGVAAAVDALQKVREYNYVHFKSDTVVAVDLEWRPHMDHRDERGSNGGPASMLQLCYQEPWLAPGKNRGEYKVYLFQLPWIGGLYGPGKRPPLKGTIEGNAAFGAACKTACAKALAMLIPGFLQDDDLVKVSVNVFSDAKKMQQLLPQHTFEAVPKDRSVRGDREKYVGFHDLQMTARNYGFKSTGLAPLLAILRDEYIKKVLIETEQDWETQDLTPRQLSYAALDVLATLLVYEELKDASRFRFGK